MYRYVYIVFVVSATFVGLITSISGQVKCGSMLPGIPVISNTESCHKVETKDINMPPNEPKHIPFNEELAWIEPGKVGDVTKIDIGNRILNRITRSTDPPIFEIPDFLSTDETFKIMEESEGINMIQSSLYNNATDKTRISTTVHFALDAYNQIIPGLSQRYQRISHLPLHVVSYQSEKLQVVRYEIGGHYFTHYDSHNISDGLPCCHSYICEISDCCQICRYLTIMTYLNDVEEGGETAFPLADSGKNDFKKFYKTHKPNINCSKASLTIKPKRGTAIMWYNHSLSNQKKLGVLIANSLHAGCDVIKGEKWIANLWICAKY